ncbi:DEAD/DEAH box helicase, putative, partial [Hepatocystis sp. ex Piliocolobus tephrosceles]
CVTDNATDSIISTEKYNANTFVNNEYKTIEERSQLDTHSNTNGSLTEPLTETIAEDIIPEDPVLSNINLNELNKEELIFYKKKKKEILKILNKFIKHKCIYIKNNKINITNFCKALCISNFTITIGINLLKEINDYEKICLYNNIHLCYICSSYNISIASFSYDLSLLKSLISLICHDRYNAYVIFEILKFDSDVINILEFRNKNYTKNSFNQKKTNSCFFADEHSKNKYNKLYISILLFLYLQKKPLSFICSAYKITEDILHNILQYTHMYIYILITFFNKLDIWILSSLLTKFNQQLKNIKKKYPSKKNIYIKKRNHAMVKTEMSS